MRKHLLEIFDKIYILDLHGNSKKKETAPNGSKDDDVFDIMQGVSINIFVKTSKSKKLADVFHHDLFGRRQEKYDFLDGNSLKSIEWKKLLSRESAYYFIPKDYSLEKTYNKLLNIEDLFIINNIGIATGKDKELVEFSKKILFEKFNIEPSLYDYKPFDSRFTIFDNKILQRARYKVMKHMVKENISLLVTSKNRQLSLGYCFLSKNISDRHLLDSAGDSMQVLPLYLYFDENTLTNTKRTPNLNHEIVTEIEKTLKLKFTPEKEQNENIFAPIDILDYIYAILHSPSYREKYKEFLKIDFPRVPFPEPKTFWKYVEKGSELRSFHLLDNPKIYEIVIKLNESENNTIERKIVKKDIEVKDDIVTIWLNDEQYITNIPLKAWEFYIGGYQPAQKWLKYRHGRVMTEEDYEYYNKAHYE